MSQPTTASVQKLPTVLLINPSLLSFKKSSKIVHFPIPYNLLCLAGTLLDNGFGAQIIDMNVTREFNPADADIIAFAMSVSTSNQISHAIKLTRHIKERYPNVTVIWGGPHPTALPEQTMQSGYPDILIVGEGEETLIELVHALQKGAPTENIPGLFTKKHISDNLPFRTRPLIALDRVLKLPYHLMDMNLYRTNEMLYQSSRGCVFKCSFCYNTSLPGGCNPWRPKSPEIVIEEIRHIVNTTRPHMLFIVDDDFLTDKKRTLEIARRFKDEKLEFTWKAFASVCHLVNYSPEELQLLKESGCTHLYLGGETIDPQIVEEYLSKKHTPEMILESTRMLKKAGIIPIFGFLTGFIGEKEDSMNKSIDFMLQIQEIYQEATIRFLGLVVPLPGTDYYHRALAHGFVGPQHLEEWAKGFEALTKRMCDPKYGGWLRPQFRKRAETAEMILDFIYYYDFAVQLLKTGRQGRRHLIQYIAFLMVFAPIYPIAKLQLKKKWFKIPLLGLVFKFVRRRFDANFE